MALTYLGNLACYIGGDISVYPTPQSGRLLVGIGEANAVEIPGNVRKMGWAFALEPVSAGVLAIRSFQDLFYYGYGHQFQLPNGTFSLGVKLFPSMWNYGSQPQAELPIVLDIYKVT